MILNFFFSFATKNLFIYFLSNVFSNLNEFDRFSIACLWSAAFFTFYWATCGLIQIVDYFCNFSMSQKQHHDNKKIFLQVLVNQMIITPLFMLATTYTLSFYRLFWWPELPIYAAIPLFILMADFFFWLLHRIAHVPFFYINFHKQHHEIKQNYASAAIYCHPLEMWMVNLLSGALPAFLVGFDDTMILVVVAASAIDTTIAHSRWSAKHFLHHKETQKLFGTSLGIVDYFFQTEMVADDFKIAEIKKKWND